MGEPTQADEFPTTMRTTSAKPDWPPTINGVPKYAATVPSDEIIRAWRGGDYHPKGVCAHQQGGVCNCSVPCPAVGIPRRASQLRSWWNGRAKTAEVAICFMGLGYGLGLMTASLVVRWLS